MSWPYSSSDCHCVTGIEKFIDPRPYLPQYESPDSNEIELPVWEQNRQAAEKRRLEELQAQSTTADSTATTTTTTTLSPQRVLKLVAHKTILTNQEYVKLVAHQVDSFYVQLNSVDDTWKNRDVSLLFQHTASGRQALVPILELGKSVPIPSDILLPGLVTVAAIAVVRTGDYSVVTTESLNLRVYDAGIRPIDWPKLKSYDVYFLYQTTVKNLQGEIKDFIGAVPKTYEVDVTINISSEDTVQSMTVPWKLRVTSNQVVGAEIRMEMVDLRPESEYAIDFTLPFDEVVKDLDFKPIIDSHAEYIVANDSVTGEAITGENAVAVNTVNIDYSAYPKISIKIPKDIDIDTVKVKFDEVIIDR